MRKAAAGELLFPPPIDLLLETRKFSIIKLMHVIGRQGACTYMILLAPKYKKQLYEFVSIDTTSRQFNVSTG